MSTALQAFDPKTIEEADRLSLMLSKSALIPVALRGKPGDILVTIMAGRELGLSPIQAMRSIHVIQGKPVMSADLIVGLCKSKRAVCVYFKLVESSAQVATYETLRKGDPGPTRMSFTIQEAGAAGLAGRDIWKKYPAAMLRARCSAAIARAVYPDLTMGVYCPDEGVDIGADPKVMRSIEAPAELANVIDVEATAKRDDETKPGTRGPAAKEYAVVDIPMADAAAAKTETVTRKESAINGIRNLLAKSCDNQKQRAKHIDHQFGITGTKPQIAAALAGLDLETLEIGLDEMRKVLHPIGEMPDWAKDEPAKPDDSREPGEDG